METMYLKIKNPKKNPKDKNLPNEIKFKTTSKVTSLDFITCNNPNREIFQKFIEKQFLYTS